MTAPEAPIKLSPFFKEMTLWLRYTPGCRMKVVPSGLALTAFSMLFPGDNVTVEAGIVGVGVEPATLGDAPPPPPQPAIAIISTIPTSLRLESLTLNLCRPISHFAPPALTRICLRQQIYSFQVKLQSH